MYQGAGLLLASDLERRLEQAFQVASEKEYGLLEQNLAYEADDFRSLALGIAAHNVAVKERAGWIQKALDTLGRAQKSKNPEIKAFAHAYKGSALTLEAGEQSATGNFFQAASLLDSGNRLLDEALKQYPNLWGIRLLHLENCLAVSEASPFSRLGDAKKDLAFLENRLNDSKPETKANLLLAKGRIAWLEKNYAGARRFFRQAIQAAPESSFAQDAQKRLNVP